jgi:hypothetical protein
MLREHDMKIVLQAVRGLQWGVLSSLIPFLVEALVCPRLHLPEHFQGLPSEMDIESTYRGFAPRGRQASPEQYRPDVLLAIQGEGGPRELTADRPNQPRLFPALNRIRDQTPKFANLLIQLRRTSGVVSVGEALRGGEGENILNCHLHHANWYVRKPVDLGGFLHISKNVDNNIYSFWLTAIKTTA